MNVFLAKLLKTFLTSLTIYISRKLIYYVDCYFTNKITFALAKKYLQGLDNVGTQCDAKLFANIKDKLSSLTKDNVHISYVLDNDYWTIKMKTYAHNAYDYKMGNKAIY